MRENDDKIDMFEVALLNEGEELVDMPVKHTFLDGMYMREIFMPKREIGFNWVTSMIHNTQHPFFVLKGKVSVFSDNDGEQLIEAPYYGITNPGTRRVLKIHQDTIWVTIHKTDIQPKDESKEAIEEAVTLIGEQILEKHENKLLGGTFKNNVFTKTIMDNN